MSSMYDIPKTPQRIRERIRRYERKLQKEKEESGMIHDGAGKRYFLGPLYLLMDDLDGAVDSFRWFEKEFPDDGVLVQRFWTPPASALIYFPSMN